MRRQLLNLPDATLSYTRSGSGPAFVFAHGCLDSVAEFEWRGLPRLAPLTAAFDLICYDARGHGESSLSLNPLDYTWKNLAYDMLGLVSGLGLNRTFLGGFSMGSGTSLWAALHSLTKGDAGEGKIAGLVLVGPSTAWDGRLAQARASRSRAVLAQEGHTKLLEDIRNSPRTKFLETALPQEYRERSLKLFAQMDHRLIAAIYEGAALSDLPPPETLKQIQVPTFILGWPDDPAHPIEMAELLASLLPNSTLLATTSPAEVRHAPAHIMEWARKIG